MAGRRTTIPLALLMAIAFGGLVALSVGVVLTLTVRANYINTFSLLNTRAVELLDGMENEVRGEADAAEKVVATVAQLYVSGKIGMEDTAERRVVLETLLRGVPSVEGIFIFDGNKLAGGQFRTPEGVITSPPPSFMQADLASLFDVESASKSEHARWGKPANIGEIAFLNVATMLKRNGQTDGSVVALTGQLTINRIISKLGREADATVFMLSGSDLVIGHSRLPEVFRNEHAIAIKDFPDEVLQKFPDAREDEEFDAAASRGVTVFTSRDGRDGHVYLIKRLTGFSAHPFTLGVYFSKADLGSEIFRMLNSLLAGIVGLLAAVAAAIFVGKQISRPAGQIANTASQFSRFEIDRIEPLPGSRIREINDQAMALNRMRTTLLQFTRYVPRQLVERLMRSGEDANRPIEREITILFTDIAGFTGFSERMNAAEITTVLNNHFAMISNHVAETSGTVDKFLGDGVLAFWGAPEADPEHALHAVNAARAIVRSMQEDNAGRRARGEAPLRLRIGIHTGRAVIGNIGGPDRQNYTIVGDTVNVAQRLEQMSRDVMGPNDETAVLASVAVVNAVGDKADFTPVGTRIVRGRERPIATFVLNVEGARTGGNVVPFTGSEPA